MVVTGTVSLHLGIFLGTIGDVQLFREITLCKILILIFNVSFIAGSKTAIIKTHAVSISSTDRLGYSGPGWLTDSDDTTCNTGNTQPVTVTLDTAIPLTWVRVVVTGAGKIDRIVSDGHKENSCGGDTKTRNCI